MDEHKTMKNLILKINSDNPNQLAHKPILINLELVDIVEYLTAIKETTKKSNPTIATIMVLYYSK